ncbi:MAG: tetratricopeptide repeat protein [Fidelibacterota bacterium]
MKYGITGLLFIALISAQIKVIPEGEVALGQALLMERAGNLKGAREIYEKVLASNPGHSRAYYQLKSILLRTSDPAVIPLIKAWLQIHPEDLQSQIELGRAYWNNQQQDSAKIAWSEFELQSLTNPNTYRLIFNAYAAAGLTNELKRIVDQGRVQFNDRVFMALDLAHYYSVRQTYKPALNEYLLVAINQPHKLRLVMDRILAMSDDPATTDLIDSTLHRASDTNPKIAHLLLAGFYFKTGSFKQALEEHELLGFSNSADQKRWLEFSNNLRQEGQYDLAIAAYNKLLTRLNQNDRKVSDTIGKALMGLGQSYEDKVTQDKHDLQFVHFFKDNILFEDRFYHQPTISQEDLSTTIEHYQSILSLLPASHTAGQARFRLGEIQYRIMRDFNGARQSYQAALQAHPRQGLRKQILLRLGDLLLAEGKIPEAENYYHKTGLAYAAGNPVSEFTIREIQAQFLSGAFDRTLALIDSLLQRLKPTHRYYNDLMELQNLIVNHYQERPESDQQAFQSFVEAEALIRQSKLSEAAEQLAFLRKTYPDASITPLATLREALIRLRFNDYETALADAEILINTDLQDQGLTLAGEIYEHYLNNRQQARNYYQRVLSECPDSIIREPVRLHIREIMNQRKES